MDNTTAFPFFRPRMLIGLGTPLLLVMLLGMMVLPLPPMVLDLVFTFNIALSLIVLLVAVYTIKPLEFAIFPTVLLIATLLRLALNVASTRVIMLNGHEGTAAAGHVIEAFGDFVVGGNYAVGLVVFAILMIINFVVVTKGAGRISEVSARFTLDAMPGKQMAVDADLNAGLLTQEEARERREEIANEADFYGAMDGASKFVRGDAVAGLLILFINIIGGFAVGMIQHDLSLADAAQNYILLTIGDGLVAQIPSLVLSTAAAIIVTRVSSSQDMGQQFITQLFSNPRALTVTAAIVGALGIVPGMPNLVFITIASIIGGLSLLLRSQQQAAARQVALEQEQPEPDRQNVDLSWDDVQPVDIVGLEVGYRLIPLVDRNQGGQLMSRIKGVRKKLSQELGFLIDPVHIRDNLDLQPGGYRINLMGVPIGQAEVYPDKELAINPGKVFGKLKGVETTDPAFGLEAVWIDAGQRDEAQTNGYTVVDASTVVATHLSHLLQQHAHELLGHEGAQQLLDMLAKSSPKLVETLVPKTLSLGVVVRVLQNLLEEGVPIRDMRTIAETLAEAGVRSQDPDILTAAVRVMLSRMIYQKINGMEDSLPAMALDPKLEQLLLQSMQGAQEGGPGIEPGLAEGMLRSLAENTRQREMNGEPAVLLVSPVLRQWLARFIRGAVQGLQVLSYNEVPDNRQVKVVGTIGGEPYAMAG
ncbi:MAG TPA: flagellar biosynthesis protein FlhA [Gammaproteobacteria bacterium]|nr:flagellar biosynthesis protein FlhA [Gammaproteobacteria bacterium]